MLLHVLLERDGSGWHARGVELDYEAGGNTRRQTMDHFISGLGATAIEHKKRGWGLSKLYKKREQAPKGEVVAFGSIASIRPEFAGSPGNVVFLLADSA